MDASIKASNDGNLIVRLANGACVTFNPDIASGRVEAWAKGGNRVYEANHADASNVWSAFRAVIAEVVQ